MGHRRVTKFSHRVNRVRHREYICDIYADGTDWLPKVYAINPQLEHALWLNRIAKAYERYQWNNWQAEFVPRKGTADEGVIMMCCDYDAHDMPPASKVEMMATAGSVRGPIWQALSLTAQSGAARGPLLLRSHAGEIEGSKSLYDQFNLVVATEGTSTGVVGELWIMYDVSLYQPTLTQSVSHVGELLGTPFNAAASSDWVFAKTAVGQQGVYDPTFDIVAPSSVNLVRCFNSQNLLLPSLGKFLLRIVFVGTAFTGFAPVVSGTSSATFDDVNPSGTSTAELMSYGLNAACTQATAVVKVEVTKIWGPPSTAIVGNSAGLGFVAHFTGGTIDNYQVTAWQDSVGSTY
jgi:hypothetical protein